MGLGGASEGADRMINTLPVATIKGGMYALNVLTIKCYLGGCLDIKRHIYEVKPNNMTDPESLSHCEQFAVTCTFL